MDWLALGYEPEESYPSNYARPGSEYMSKPASFYSLDKNLQTETLAASTQGTAVALPKRKLIGISVDGKTQMAFGYSANITAGPLYDSYSESNQDALVTLNAGGTVGVGQSFTGEASIGSVLASCQFYMKKTLLPTGNATAKVYDIAGTDGSTAVPSGAALASSGTLDVSTLTGTLALKTFTFTGANKIVLRRDRVYALTVEYAGGDGTNNVQVGTDSSAPSHAGNSTTYNGTTWTADAGVDVVFYTRVTEADILFPAAGWQVQQPPQKATHLILYNPASAASVISSVTELTVI